MKRLVLIVFVISLLTSVGFGKFALVPLKERVKESNLIVIGSISDVSEYENKENIYSSATLHVDKVIWRQFIPIHNSQSNIKLKVRWVNSKLFACQMNFPKNIQYIWLLKSNKDGTIEPLYFGATEPRSEINKVKKYVIKEGKPIQFINDVKEHIKKEKKPTQSTIVTGNTNVNRSSEIKVESRNSPLAALIVLLLSILLYLTFYKREFL